MSADLAADLVELAPYIPPAGQCSPLREVAFRGNAWLPREIALLRKMFANDSTFEEIGEALGRGRAGVADKAYSLGLRRTSRRPWTELEDGVLVKRYGSVAAAAIAQELGRSCASIYVRAQLLDLTEGNPPPWTEWEDAQLRAGYEQGIPCTQLAALIGRPLAGMFGRAGALGLRHPRKPDDWSDAEMLRALELAEEGHRYLAIIEMLVAEGYPRRSKSGYGQRIRILGYGRGWGRSWTTEEEDLLRHVYATGGSVVRLADRLGRGRSGVRWKVKDLGLQGTHEKAAGFRQGPVWSPEEDETLRANYGKMKTGALAQLLGRPKTGVFNRAWQLGVKHGYWRHYTADEQRAFRIAYERGIALADLAIAIERSALTISKHATDKLGLHFGRRQRRKPPLSLEQILALDPAAEPLTLIPRSERRSTVNAIRHQ